MSVVSAALSAEQYLGLAKLAARHNVSVSLILRGIIADALAEEGLDGRTLQRWREEACTGQGEAGRAEGAPAS